MQQVPITKIYISYMVFLFPWFFVRIDIAQVGNKSSSLLVSKMFIFKSVFMSLLASTKNYPGFNFAIIGCNQQRIHRIAFVGCIQRRNGGRCCDAT